MENFTAVLDKIDGFMWGVPLIALLLGTGLLLTIRLGAPQLRHLGKALRIAFNKKSIKAEGAGDITPFQALMTTLAATVGNGNIAGVALAIAAGGPGALVWMWVAALLGMTTRMTEAMLGMKYRKEAKDGSFIGGAFYYLENGASEKIGKGFGKVLAVLFAVFGMFASFGIGNMVQANTVALSVNGLFNIPAASSGTANIIIGIVLVVMTALVLLGGIKSIGKVTGKLVPVMAILYIGTVFIILIMNITSIPAAFALIFKSAFTGQAAIGGVIGITAQQAMRMGMARGVFSNEAGLGTGSMAHSAAKTSEPARQGMVAMTGTFIDTILICTMTGLAIVLMLLADPSTTALADFESSQLTMQAFNSFLPGFGGAVVAICSILFGYSTLIGWYYYGEQCTEYLFGVKSNIPFRVLFVLVIFVGAVTKIGFVWSFSDIANAAMAIPNLIGLIVLSGVASKELKGWLSTQDFKG